MKVAEEANKGLLDLYIDSHTRRPTLSPSPSSSKRHSRPQKPRETRSEKKERLALLATQPVATLFQRNPFKTNTSVFMPKSYTQNIESFCCEARRRRSAIIRNLQMTGRHFTHLVTINLYEPHHPALLNRDFGAFRKELGKHNLDGHWTIEINRQNVVHWHLLVLDSPLSSVHLKTLIKSLLQKANFPRSRVEVEKKQNERYLIDYVLKVLKPGFQLCEQIPDALGCRTFSASSPDLYATKRVLFVKGTGLDKHGIFGTFWAKGWNQRKFWDQVKVERKRIEENLKDPRVRSLVELMHKTMGFSLTTAKWAFALDPDLDGVTPPANKPTTSQATKSRKQTKKQLRTRRRIQTLYKGRKASREAPSRSVLPLGLQAIPRPIRPTRTLILEVSRAGSGLDVRIPRSRPP